MSGTSKRRQDAIACYFLSQKQGVAMIARLMDKTEQEVEELIEEGRRIFQDADDSATHS